MLNRVGLSVSEITSSLLAFESLDHHCGISCHDRIRGTLFVTTEPAATTEFSPMVTPLRMVAFMPIQTLSE